MILTSLDNLSVTDLLAGQHVCVLGDRPNMAGVGRRHGLELRDTLLVLSVTGPSFAFLFRKELAGTVAENVLRYGTGGLWIDGCRISTEGERLSISRSDPFHKKDGTQLWNPTSSGVVERTQHQQGRWPTNLVLVHAPECRPGNPTGVWTCQAGCPVVALDQQSGYLHGSGNKSSTGNEPGNPYAASSYHISYKGQANRDYGSAGGGASRFFPQFENEKQFTEWLGRLMGGPEDQR